MQLHVNDDEEEIIEQDSRFSKSNYGSRKNYSIESAILEKRLVFDSSLLTNNLIIHHLTDLKSCYNHQLVNIGGLIEESVSRDGNVMQLILKLIPRWKHYISIVFGISEEYYSEENEILAGTGQENKFLGDLCIDMLYLIISIIEKKHLGIIIKDLIEEIDK